LRLLGEGHALTDRRSHQYHPPVHPGVERLQPGSAGTRQTVAVGSPFSYDSYDDGAD
jgi:hypothetical protein